MTYLAASFRTLGGYVGDSQRGQSRGRENPESQREFG